MRPGLAGELSAPSFARRGRRAEFARTPEGSPAVLLPALADTAVLMTVAAARAMTLPAKVIGVLGGNPTVPRVLSSPCAAVKL
ncbi:hypothetical protein [Amycolatopsis sp. NPDC054798]